MEEINDLLSKIGKDRELNDLLKLKKYEWNWCM